MRWSSASSLGRVAPGGTRGRVRSQSETASPQFLAPPSASLFSCFPVFLINILLTQCLIDGGRKNLSNFSLQPERDRRMTVVISRAAIDYNIRHAALRGDEWKGG